MSIQANLSNSVRARYEEDYLQAAMQERLYDQFAVPASADKDKLQRNSSIVLNFISDMDIETTAISETTDVTPQTLRDATVSISGTSRRGAIQDSEKLLLEAYTPYAAERMRIVGKNMMLSVDELAKAAMLQGALVDRNAARAALNAGTAGDRLADSDLAAVEARLAALRVPSFIDGTDGVHGGPRWMALMGPEPYYDLRSTGNVLSIATYGHEGQILLNNELGQIGQFRLVVSPFAKTFGAAGAVNASAIDTTIATTAVKALDTTVTVAANTNIDVGDYMWVGTEETGNTFYPMNEKVEVVGIANDPIMDIVGQGPNGGFLYDHAIGEACSNADSVHTVAYGGPSSIAKVFASEVGEYGQIVGPSIQGLLDQWVSLGWKWYGGYGRITDAWLVRGEYASSFDG